MDKFTTVLTAVTIASTFLGGLAMILNSRKSKGKDDAITGEFEIIKKRMDCGNDTTKRLFEITGDHAIDIERLKVVMESTGKTIESSRQDVKEVVSKTDTNTTMIVRIDQTLTMLSKHISKTDGRMESLTELLGKAINDMAIAITKIGELK